MKELIATPRSLATLKQELDAGFGSSPIESLAYLQACVKETLRLHPPAPLMLSHRAGETCHVMGYVVPKDAHVSVNVWAIGRDPNVWDEPLEYRPERFLGPSSVDFKGNDFEFLPFGAGRRICPGVPMAAKIVPLVVANLVYYFDWESTKGSVDEEFRATSQMKEPLIMISRARK